MAQYYIVFNNTQVGPMDKQQLLSYGLNPQSQVWCEGMPQWAPAYTIPELMDLISNNPNPVPPVPAQPAKDKIVFGVLALLLGCFGIQYFYIGKTAAGLLTILLTFVTCSLWGLIVFIQGIIVLCGTQEEFERKFVNSTSTLPLF